MEDGSKNNEEKLEQINSSEVNSAPVEAEEVVMSEENPAIPVAEESQSQKEEDSSEPQDTEEPQSSEEDASESQNIEEPQSSEEETSESQNTEDTQNSEEEISESQNTEEPQSSEEEVSESQNIEESQSSEEDSSESQNIEEPQSSEEDISEPQNTEDSQSSEEISESQNIEDSQSSEEASESQNTEEPQSSEAPVMEDSQKSEEQISEVAKTDDSKNTDEEPQRAESESSSEKPEVELQQKVEQEATPVSASSDDKQKDSEEEKPVVRKYKKPFISEFWRSFLFDIFFLAICAAFIVVLLQKWVNSQNVLISGATQTQSSIDSGEGSSIGNVNILLMGIDSVEGTHRSDTIIVLGVNPSKCKINMLSIPRDTRVVIDGKGRKINEILPRYGEPTLRKILEDLLKINISYRVEIGFESFISVIDAIGGVDINVEKAMNYDDNWGNLHIHFKPGMNHLDGRKALNYVRFRKDAMADLGRIKRQQDFVKAVILKMVSPSTVVRLPAILETAFKYIDTDFTFPEIITLVKGFKSYDVKLNSVSLPGEARYIDKISFFMPYSEQAVAYGNSYFSDQAMFELEVPFTAKHSLMDKHSNRKK